STVFVKVYIGGGIANGGEEYAFDSLLEASDLFDYATGGDNSIAWGEYLAAATNRGADMYLIGYMSSSPTATDAPHLTPYPRLLGYGGADYSPTSEGNYHAWTGDPTVSPSTYQDV